MGTPASPAVRTEDQRIFLNDVSWAALETILEIRGDQAGVRLTYLNGTLELMTPSVDHEGIKKTIARLLEAYADETGIPFNGPSRTVTVSLPPRLRIPVIGVRRQA